MKQLTDKAQTDRLMELGYSIPKVCTIPTISGDFLGFYTIGELLSFLPNQFEYEGISYSKVINVSELEYYSWELEVYYGEFSSTTGELIDSLYKACVHFAERFCELCCFNPCVTRT